MAARDIFALIVRALGAYAIFKALETGVWVLGAACGFDMHAHSPVGTDAFFALCFLIIGLAAIAWADRAAAVVYRRKTASPAMASDVVEV